MHMRLECIGVVHVALLAVPVWLLCAPALSLLEVRVCCPLLSLLLWVVIWFSNGPTDSPISLYVQVSCDQLMQETNFCPVLACTLEEKRRKEKIYIKCRPQSIDLSITTSICLVHLRYTTLQRYCCDGSSGGKFENGIMGILSGTSWWWEVYIFGYIACILKIKLTSCMRVALLGVQASLSF